MGITDDDVIREWRKLAKNDEQNYAEVGRVLGIHRQSVRMRVLKLRAEGLDLPPAKQAGYTLTSERAREIGQLRRTKNA